MSSSTQDPEPTSSRPLDLPTGLLVDTEDSTQENNENNPPEEEITELNLPQEDNNQSEAQRGLPAEEVNAAVELLSRGVSPQDFDLLTLRCCIAEMNNRKREASAQKDYMGAQKWLKLVKSASKAADVADFTGQCTTTLADLMQKQADAGDNLDSLNELWSTRFADFEALIDEKQAEIVKQHTEEIDTFEKSIQEDLPPKFLKHSPDYIQMRKKESLLARNQDFIQAAIVKKKADALQEVELSDMYQRYSDDVQRRREQMYTNQKTQLDAFLQTVNTQRHELLRSRERDMEGPLKRYENYTKQVESIEEKGLPPNPYYGHTTNRVSRKESIKAVRTAALTPLERDPAKKKTREDLPMQYRPSSSLRKSQRK